ncbi:TetR/AcrR family transcriptional regulator [Cumulibacter soli]|uniref:TetR/AcrR family transcriptional regulator n=1 Tax=Cumulibacter soli TaxID=2546344 RepID=UPI001068B09A|nr:TetR/AcrR family transcriptional regulator [Cumulibacter soli]
MPTRPEIIADAAVTVVSRDGVRGLTHRAVDAEAALPAGSTSNCYRNREALLGAIVERIEELDTAALKAGPSIDVSSVVTIATYLADRVHSMTTPRRVRATRARFALLLDETARGAMESGHFRLLGMLEGMLRELEHPAPERAARAVADLLEGALVHAVAVRSRKIDTATLADAVQRLLQ